jgi:hypothetical protein
MGNMKVLFNFLIGFGGHMIESFEVFLWFQHVAVFFILFANFSYAAPCAGEVFKINSR